MQYYREISTYDVENEQVTRVIEASRENKHMIMTVVSITVPASR